MRILAAGETPIGDTSETNGVQLTATATACVFVRLMAPTTDNESGLNTGSVYAADGAGAAVTHANCLAKGLCIANNNYEGDVLHCADASHVRVAGLNAGDAVRWQAIG
jgi:hypothetical protein